MATWIDGDALMKYWTLWCWTDTKGMPHEFAYIPAPVVTRAIEAAKNSGVEMKPVVHAHWIKEFFPGSVECGLPILVDATCSNCNFKMYESYLYCPQCGCKMDNGMVLDCERKDPAFKVYRKDILTGAIDVFDHLDQRTVERHTGHSMAFRDHWEGGKAWERYKYIVIRIGGAWDNERKSQLFIGW